MWMNCTHIISTVSFYAHKDVVKQYQAEHREKKCSKDYTILSLIVLT